ncbi:hypothetical protein AAVH_21236 [Aphelenchoides avenae]|nr:hypothetical protein AAVH_21236 [Aphelenchus avenae]
MKSPTTTTTSATKLTSFIGDLDYDDHNIVYDDYNTDVDDDDFDDDIDYYFDDYYDDDDEDVNDDNDNYEDFPFLELDPPPENNLTKALHYMPTGN